MAKQNGYQKITDTILEIIQNGGELAWRKGWKISGQGAAQNPDTGTVYSGVNGMLLGAMQHIRNYKTAKYVTYKGAMKLEAVKCVATSQTRNKAYTKSVATKVLNRIRDRKTHIAKGATGYPVVYFNFIPKHDESEIEDESEQEYFPLCKYSTVFNLDDVANINMSKYIDETELEDVDYTKGNDIVDQYADCPEIKFGGNSAYYRPSHDFIGMPNKAQFESEEAYFGTLFHEMAHSTGHEARLNRNIVNKFGTKAYAREELVAELASMMLLGEANLEADFENSAAYISGWASADEWANAMREDDKLIIWAASRAEKAAHYILGNEQSE